jgi:hypothetical protein
MPDIELSTVGTVAIDRTADKFPFIDVSPTPDVTKYATANDIAGLIRLGFALSDHTTDLTVGTNKFSFDIPAAFTVTGVYASVDVAPTGSTIIVDINEGAGAGTTILSTKLSIDASETNSSTAASAAVISDTSLAANARVTFDIDQVGSSTPGKGLIVWLIGYWT